MFFGGRTINGWEVSLPALLLAFLVEYGQLCDRHFYLEVFLVRKNCMICTFLHMMVGRIQDWICDKKVHFMFLHSLGLV